MSERMIEDVERPLLLAEDELEAVTRRGVLDGHDENVGAAIQFEYEREDGTTVHGDASGEWRLDESGDLEDIVFFASPRSMGYGRKAT